MKGIFTYWRSLILDFFSNVSGLFWLDFSILRQFGCFPWLRLAILYRFRSFLAQTDESGASFDDFWFFDNFDIAVILGSFLNEFLLLFDALAGSCLESFFIDFIWFCVYFQFLQKVAKQRLSKRCPKDQFWPAWIHRGQLGSWPMQGDLDEVYNTNGTLPCILPCRRMDAGARIG